MDIENEYLPADAQDVDEITNEVSEEDYIDMVEYVRDCIEGGVISEEEGKELLDNEDWDEIRRRMEYEDE